MIKMIFESVLSFLIVVSFTDAFPQVSPTLDPGKYMFFNSNTINLQSIVKYLDLHYIITYKFISNFQE